MQQSKHPLYLIVLFSIIGVIIIALGGGIWGQSQPWWMQWQHRAFLGLCHQLPERSFWINGQPMAVCSRCLGIYAGFGLGWLSLTLIRKSHKYSLFRGKKILMLAIVINLADFIGNLLGFWENTLVSRLLLGGLLGSAAALLFSGSFFNRKIKNTGTHHGRITTGI